MTATPYRGRLAPSPTGALHLGHARTFLIAWLRARQQQGTVVLRLEDLDTTRQVAGAADAICTDLEWLGLTWDEGPYRQSERQADYARALSTLQKLGRVYPCTCSRREIANLASAPHHPAELGNGYPGTCRKGPTHPERAASWRFLVPDQPPGHRELGARQPSGDPSWSDFVVRRADGVWAYQLAVAVDDHAMGISEVVRGDDLLTSTPRQVALLAALGHHPPNYLHVPLLLGEDGQRLSKRHASRSVATLREEGHAPEAIIGSLAASLGLGTGSPAPAAELVPLMDRRQGDSSSK